MRKFISSLALGAITAVSLTSCAAGPHQLRRTVDDWDHKMYVNSPWVDAVLWVIPVIPLANLVAGIGDFLVTDAYCFWLHDAWDGKGTGYEHLKVEAKDGTLGSLLSDGTGWLKMSGK